MRQGRQGMPFAVAGRCGAAALALGLALALAPALIAGSPANGAASGGRPAADHEWTFVGVVLGLRAGAAPGADKVKVILVGPDPRFSLRVAVQEWRGQPGPWPPGADLVLGIHSPSRLFGGSDTAEPSRLVGERYVFRLQGEAGAAGSGGHFTGLSVLEHIAAPPRTAGHD